MHQITQYVHQPAHLRGLMRYFTGLRDGVHGDGVVTRED